MKKLTKTLSLILCLSLILGVVSSKTFNVFASTSGTTGDCTWTLNGTELTISGNGEMADYTFDTSAPWGTGITKVTIENGVTKIGDCSFDCCDSLTSATIPNSVTAIGESAFSVCNDFTNITIPSSVTSIGGSAFYGSFGTDTKNINISDLSAWCKISFGGTYVNPLFGAKLYLNGKEITDLIIPSDITCIGSYAFGGCFDLTSVTIPNGITSIGDYAFYNCNCLTNVTIPHNVTGIGDYAFCDCSGLTNITIGNSVKSIGDYAFSNCDHLTSIAIPNSVTSIGEGAFAGCYDLVNVTLENGLKSIGDYAFSYCDHLTSITIPSGVTNIGDETFYRCSRLTNVTIPNGVTAIGELAFGDCDDLTSITIPDSVTSIGDYAFARCYGLTKVNISDLSAWCNISFSDSDANPLSFAGHLYLNGKEITDLIIPNNVTSIGDYAFYNCQCLTNVTIPSGVTSIGDDAFYYCYKLVEVINHSKLDISAGSKDYGYVAYYAIEVHNGNESKIIDKNGYLFYTFDDTNYLIGYIGAHTNLILPEKYNGENYEIYDYAFFDCDHLTSIAIPDSVISISNHAFCDCSGLTNITIGNSVKSIGDYAFSACDHLTSIAIPNSVTSIGEGAFAVCYDLVNVTLGNSVKSIGDYAFSDCDHLTSITIPNSVTSIGAYAFYACYGITSIIIPNSVKSIDICAFRNCVGLTSVTIPNSVTSIGNYAFYHCVGLTSITIPNSVTSIGNYAFCDCDHLTSITIPNGVTSIGSDAFLGCINLAEVINFSSLDITAGSEDYGYVAYYAKKVIGSQTTILCDNATAKQNETVTLDLKLKRNTGFMALNLAIIYDKENLELTNIENKLAGFMMSADSSIVWDGSKDYTEDGTIATLTFKVKENASYGDYQIKVNFFEASDYDGNDIQMDTVAGKIKVCGTEIIKGDLNKDGNITDADLTLLRKALLSRQEYAEIFDANSDKIFDVRDLIYVEKCIK